MSSRMSIRDRCTVVGCGARASEMRDGCAKHSCQRDGCSGVTGSRRRAYCRVHTVCTFPGCRAPSSNVRDTVDADRCARHPHLFCPDCRGEIPAMMWSCRHCRCRRPGCPGRVYGTDGMCSDHTQTNCVHLTDDPSLSSAVIPCKASTAGSHDRRVCRDHLCKRSGCTEWSCPWNPVRCRDHICGYLPGGPMYPNGCHHSEGTDGVRCDLHRCPVCPTTPPGDPPRYRFAISVHCTRHDDAPPTCDLGCLEHFNGKYSDRDPGRNPCQRSAKNGHLACLRYAHENECPWDEMVCMKAVASGHIECLRYAHENGAPWNEDVCTMASISGHLDCLRYAHENGAPWNEGTCSWTARAGQLECLRYAHENGAPWNETTCFLTAGSGQLECLRYAHENGCPWDEETCSLAAYSGQLECLRYAHENGCPWDEETCQYASDGGHLECLRYAHEEGAPWNMETIKVALLNGNLGCLRYADENGCPWPPPPSFKVHYRVVSYAYHRGFFPMLHWLNEDAVRRHIRRHASTARVLLRSAVRLLGAYQRACERVYAPDGVGYLEACESFLSALRCH